MAVRNLNDDGKSKDVLFQMSDYNVPLIVNGPDAWTHNILDILFLEKGTYSDSPDLGLDLNSITYMDVDSTVSYVSSELNYQVRKYLPDVPVTNLTVTTKPTATDESVLNIQITFSLDYGRITKSAFVSLRDKLVDKIVDRFDSV